MTLGPGGSGLAEALEAVHDVARPSPGVLPDYRPYRQQSYDPPRWARDATVWERAVEMFHGPAPDIPPRFVHRDFHPGNVLWAGGSVGAIVDWPYASIGIPDVDVGHTRLNLFFYDDDLARSFTAAWEELAGARFHPWADVVAIVGSLDNLRAHPPAARARVAIEEALVRAAESE